MNAIGSNRKERRAFVRVVCEPDCLATVKMIGQSIEKTCHIIRLSEDACELSYDGEEALIFNEQSILEVRLNLSGTEEIFFFSRFIRYLDEHTFAIKVTEIESADFTKLSRFVSDHTKKQGA
jgi:hypothetical protein